jgi:hypothetical protein
MLGGARGLFGLWWAAGLTGNKKLAAYFFLIFQDSVWSPRKTFALQKQWVMRPHIDHHRGEN